MEDIEGGEQVQNWEVGELVNGSISMWIVLVLKF